MHATTTDAATNNITNAITNITNANANAIAAINTTTTSSLHHHPLTTPPPSHYTTTPSRQAIFLASQSSADMGGPLQFLLKLAFVGDVVSFYRSTTMDGATPLLLWVKVLSVALVCASGWYTLRAGLVRARARLSARFDDLNSSNGPYGLNGPNGKGGGRSNSATSTDRSRSNSATDQSNQRPSSALGNGPVCDLSGFSVLVTGLPSGITRSSSAHEVADVFSSYGQVVHVAIGVRELGKVAKRQTELSNR